MYGNAQTMFDFLHFGYHNVFWYVHLELLFKVCKRAAQASPEVIRNSKSGQRISSGEKVMSATL